MLLETVDIQTRNHSNGSLWRINNLSYRFILETVNDSESMILETATLNIRNS